jgi:hypothetical protein
MSTFKSIQELMRDTVMTFDLMTYSIQELMRDTVMTFDLMTYSIQELMRDTVMANDPLTSKYSRTNEFASDSVFAVQISQMAKCSQSLPFHSF